MVVNNMRNNNMMNNMKNNMMMNNNVRNNNMGNNNMMNNMNKNMMNNMRNNNMMINMNNNMIKSANNMDNNNLVNNLRSKTPENRMNINNLDNNDNNDDNNFDIDVTFLFSEKLEISQDDIHNKKEASKMKDLLTCPICHNILISPVQCDKCNKCFCKRCIHDYKDSKTKCPFKCENPTYTENKFVKNVLSILKFKCKNKCGEIINYEDLERHYIEECNRIDFKASYKDLLTKYKALYCQNFKNKSLIKKLTKKNNNANENIGNNKMKNNNIANNIGNNNMANNYNNLNNINFQNVNPEINNNIVNNKLGNNGINMGNNMGNINNTENNTNIGNNDEDDLDLPGLSTVMLNNN
jgi:hypothetical protein